MSDLPTGTLTLLFTDIEGSTAVLARLGARYADVVSAYRAVVRDAVRRWSGHELGTEGDSFFVVFRSVGDAVRAVLDAQTALVAAAWPGGETVRVRMGLHTGEPTRHEDGYVGMDVHRAARVAGAAHGGQVLVTEATYRIAAADPVPGVTFADLGLHRLKDLAQPERLHQLVAPGLPDRFPRPRSLGSASTLPLPSTALVGRDDDVARVVRTIGGMDARLVTLTGPGGAGKTRLALAAAAAIEDRFADGVFLVPLAPVRATEVMWTTVADVVGAPGESKAPPTVLAHLAPRRVLLVLDNLEQIAGAPAVVSQLVASGPGVAVLATSRRPLRVSGEHEVPVEPLPVPEVEGLAGTDGSGAVELFVRRARLVRPGFALTADNVADVVEICRRLDGLPLAIELVAARTRLLGPRALLARLDQDVAVARPAVDVPERHRTLEATLTWSYELLPEPLRAAFRRLGACGGDVDLAAAEAVLAEGTAGGGEGDDAAGGAYVDAVEVVAELVDASLLTVLDGPDGEPRVRMLRTVASFARSMLRASGERDVVGLRHARHFAEVARTAAEQLRGPNHLAARDRLERELPNLRAALAWSLAAPGGGAGAGAGAHAGVDPDERLGVGLRLCEHLSWFWYACGYQAEGRRWLGAAVEAAGGRATGGGPAEVVTALFGLGVLVLQQGQADRAREMLERCLVVWRAAGDATGTARALNSLAMAHRALGDHDEAVRLAQESADVARDVGDLGREVNAVSNLAVLAVDRGDTDRAVELLRRCLELDVALEDAWGQGADHVNLTGALLRAGRVDEAEEHLRANAADAVALNDVEITIDVLSLFAGIAAHRRQAVRAARLLGASTRLREQADVPLTATDAVWFDAAIALVEGRPDGATWDAEVAAGRALDAAAAVALALT
ncbi:tetratricopeptide repeat protein [Actinotalea ferrariae]|uniref:ATP-binding protein n=1 Tax=Actinotalea ferrariae TaxID=1386098 RepID=UPI001C8C8F67|nr:tetratricopeptide repeat protein [Actinotalea ferrariae]MBX9245200.1 tetratricopeptide repeat protein [Actinotalea ferrariae]